MIFWIILFLWLIVVPIILILSKRDLESIKILCLSQLYNFIVGFSAWSILFIVFCISFGRLNGGQILFFSLVILVYLLLLIPANMYITRKKNIDIIRYVILSTLIFASGAITFWVLGDIMS